MSFQSSGGWLLAACFLATTPAFAQHTQETDTDTVGAPTHGVSPGAKKPDLKRVEQMIFEQTNRFRARKGRHELKLNAELSKAAHDFADFMARTDRYGHTADGKTPGQRVTEHGYRYCIVAENIAWDYNSEGFTTRALADGLFDGWRHSPPHRRNLLDPDLYDIGVAVAYSPQSGRYYAVQDFGRPHSRAVAFQITNDSDATVHYTVGEHSFSLPPRYTRTHRRCRPATLEFENTDSSGGEEVFHPRNGAHYVIRSEGSGGYKVARESSGLRP